MTTVTYENNIQRVRILIDGHAGFNPGNDIVCASVSTLTYQLLNVLCKMENECKVDDVYTEITDGRVLIRFSVDDVKTWNIVWDVVSMGFINLEDAYPDYIRLVGVTE